MTERAIPHYDVIVIGAGSVGTPTALSLAQAGLKALVIDRAASAGQESNKRAIGGIRATHSDPAKISLGLRSIEIFSSWKKQYGDEIEWYQGGYCFVAYHPKEEMELKELLVKQKAYALNINWVDRNSLLEITPDLNPNNLLGGIYSPDDGNASPLLAIHAFYKHAKESGVVFHFNELLIKIIVRGGKIKAVQTDKGIYGTDCVINAAGPWANIVSQMVNFDLPIHPDTHEAAITEPVAHFIDPMIVDMRVMPGSSNFYFYQHFTGQIVFCITPSPNIWGYDTEETSGFLPMSARRLVGLVPRLRNIRVRRVWRGLYPMTPDGLPIVGTIHEIQGYVLAAGMCGQGFMLGPGLGELITRIAVNALTPNDMKVLEYLSPYRHFGGEERLK